MLRLFLVLLFTGTFTGTHAATLMSTSANAGLSLLSEQAVANAAIELFALEDENQDSLFAESESGDNSHPIHGFTVDLFPSISGGPQAYKAKTQYAQYSDTVIRGPPLY